MIIIMIIIIIIISIRINFLINNKRLLTGIYVSILILNTKQNNHMASGKVKLPKMVATRQSPTASARSPPK